MSPRILIAENDAQTRGLLAEWLEDAGFNCALTATDGAFAEAERCQPDAALVSVDTADGAPMRVAHSLVNWPDAVAAIVVSRPSIRPYRDPLTHEEADAELTRVAGTQLDPEVVRAWIRMTESRAC